MVIPTPPLGYAEQVNKDEREGSPSPSERPGFVGSVTSGGTPAAVPDSHKLLKCHWCGQLFRPTCDVAIPDYRLAMTMDPPICGVCLETTEANKIKDIAESVRRDVEWQLEKK